MVSVVGLDIYGKATGPLDGVQVQLSGSGSQTTGANGTVTFYNLDQGVYGLTATKDKYFESVQAVPIHWNDFSVVRIEMLPTEVGTNPIGIGFEAANGVHFLPGIPGTMKFTLRVRWNDSNQNIGARKATFRAPGVSMDATLTPINNDWDLATVVMNCPGSISVCEQLRVELTNGIGNRGEFTQPCWFHPNPAWVGNIFFKDLFWLRSGDQTLSLPRGHGFRVVGGAVPAQARGCGREGVATGSAWAAASSTTCRPPPSRPRSRAKARSTERRRSTTSPPSPVVRRACSTDIPAASTSATRPRSVARCQFSFGIKTGFAAPVSKLAIVIPPAKPIVATLEKIPYLGDWIQELIKFKIYFPVVSGAMKGEWTSVEGPGPFGTSKVTGALSIGVEGSVFVDVSAVEFNVGMTLAGAGEAEFQARAELPDPLRQIEGIHRLLRTVEDLRLQPQV